MRVTARAGRPDLRQLAHPPGFSNAPLIDEESMRISALPWYGADGKAGAVAHR